jgi:acyl-CoA hydrolase
VRVDAEDLLTGKVVHVSSAYLVFVAIGDDGKTARLPPLLAESEDEKRRMAAAKLRRERRTQHR